MPKTDYSSGPVPAEALSFFKAKKLRPTFDHRDAWREEHAVSFSVAKAAQMDVLADIKDGLDQALADGKTFAQFKKELTPLLQKKGWWGKREMLDPETGEIKNVQLGSPRRLKTIFDANMRTARAAGQWERIQRNKATHPYLAYRLGPSMEHRVDHAAWEGIILPVDDPFWTTHFAPNGYGCKCRIVAVSKVKYEQLMATGKYTDKAPKPEFKTWHNKRTGQTETLPRGIDPGWDTNPGHLRQVGVDRALVTKSLVLDKIDDARELMYSPVKLREYEAWTAGVLKQHKHAEMRAVSVLGDVEIDHLTKVGHVAKETLVTVSSFSIRGAAATTERLTDAQWKALPLLINDSQHLFYNYKRKEFVYMTKDGDDWIRIDVQTDWVADPDTGLSDKFNHVDRALRVTKKTFDVLVGHENYKQLR